MSPLLYFNDNGKAYKILFKLDRFGAKEIKRAFLSKAFRDIIYAPKGYSIDVRYMYLS